MADRLISKDDLWKKFSINPNTGQRYKTRDCDNFKITVYLEDVQREILLSPTIEVREHGLWIPNNFGDIFRCSECGYGITKEDRIYFHFCPRCGAKMDGDIDGEKEKS